MASVSGPDPGRRGTVDLSDLRFALRVLRRTPGPTAVVAGTLAVAIAAGTVVYSTIDIVWHLLPITNRDGVVYLRSVDSRRSESTRLGVSIPDLVDLTEQVTSFDAVAGFSFDSANLTGSGAPVRVSFVRATANLPSVWGLRATLGRVFQSDENRLGAARVALLTNSFWRRQFEGSPSVIGTTVLLNDEPHTIAGVLSEGASIGAWRGQDLVVVRPLDPAGTARDQRDVFVTARLKQRVSRDAATAEVRTIAERLESAYPLTNAGVHIEVLPLIELSGSNVRFLIFVLGLVALLVVAMACANVTNIALAQAAVRRHERAVRAALGATRLQQIRQSMLESFVTSALAGAIGLVLAQWGLMTLRWFAGAENAIYTDLAINTRVFVASVLTACAAPVAFALLPAIRSSRADPTALTRVGRFGTAGPGVGRTRHVIVAAQVALAMILLIQIGVLARGVQDLSTRSIGFNPRQLLTFRVELSSTRYAAPLPRTQFFQTFLEQIAGLPDVAAAGAIDRLPIADEETTIPVRVEGTALQLVPELPLAARAAISAGYVRAMGLPLLEGRDLTESDMTADSTVALVSEAAARRLWPEKQPLGSSRIGFASQTGVEQWLTVVGVVGDIRNSDADQAPLPQVYVPVASRPPTAMAVVVRTARRDPLALVSEVRTEMTRLDPNQPIHDIATMEQVIFNDLVGTWVLMALLGAVAFVALCLAAAGIYGVVSFVVSQRTKEIGVRIALGAAPRVVRRMVVWQGSLPAVVGGAVGMAIAIAIAFMTAGSIPEMDVRDPTAYVIVAITLSAIAVGASYFPARRASEVDPAVTLRAE